MSLRWSFDKNGILVLYKYDAPMELNYVKSMLFRK